MTDEEIMAAIERAEFNLSLAKYLEEVRDITIENEDWLAKILDRTAKKEASEWGAILVVGNYDSRAGIFNCAESEVFEMSSLIKKNKEGHIDFDLEGILEIGYGILHYRPEVETLDQIPTVNSQYRDNRLLYMMTFNLKTGPEIIGCIKNRIYMSINEEKTVLSETGIKI